MAASVEPVSPYQLSLVTSLTLCPATASSSDHTSDLALATTPALAVASNYASAPAPSDPAPSPDFDKFILL